MGRRKAKARAERRLAARIKAYEETVSKSATSTRGLKKPGSLKCR